MKRNFLYLTVIVLAIVLRFWKLGEIPGGITLEEANLGIYFSGVFGIQSLDATFVRLPFALTGIVTVGLLFWAMKEIKRDFWFSYTAVAILALSPWHVQESRIFSLGMLVFAMSLAPLLIFPSFVKKSVKTIGVFAVFLAVVIFFISLLDIPRALRANVDQQRSITSKKSAVIPVQIFSNKFIESYRFRQRLLFEHLDFGNYFFKGHPRQRWGVEETQKFFVILLPILLLGFLKINKKGAWFLTGFTFLTISLLVLFEVRGPSISLPIIYPMIFVISEGAIYLENIPKFRPIAIFVIVLFIFEAIVFFKSYFKGFEEAQFSPRRPIYAELVPTINQIAINNERILVNQRLKDPEPFFKFYLKKKDLQNFEFRTFDIKKETGQGKIFVDVLPDDPSPAEPLYRKDGNWPDGIKPLAEFYDEGLKQKVIVYRYEEE